jgi:hypothetical protein
LKVLTCFLFSNQNCIRCKIQEFGAAGGRGIVLFSEGR